MGEKRVGRTRRKEIRTTASAVRDTLRKGMGKGSNDPGKYRRARGEKKCQRL